MNSRNGVLTPARGGAPRSRDRRTGPAISRLDAVVGTVVVAGAVAEALAWAAHPAWPAVSALWKLALTAALVAVSDTVTFHLRFGSENYTLTWSEAAIVLGLALTPWPLLTLLAPLGLVVAQVAAHRAPKKIAFNAGCMATASTVAALCAWATAGTRDLADVGRPTAAAALCAAATGFFVVNDVCLSAVIAAARGIRLMDVLREGFKLKLCLLVGNTLIALLLLSTPWRGTVLVLIPTNLVLLFFSYRGYHRATEEGGVWRQLDAAAKELTALDASELTRAAVIRAAYLFSADCVEIVSAASADGPSESLRYDGGVIFATTESSQSEWSQSVTQPLAAVTVEAPLTVASGDGADAQTIGVLRLGFHDQHRLSDRQQRVLRTFAHGVATSLQNARLYTEMRYRAERSAYEAARDPLTGVANRKDLNRVLAESLDATASNQRLWLLLVDLDHFKEINDTLGHPAGDAVLCAVASRLAAKLSPPDMVARLGGDEFAILLHGISDEREAEAEANRFLQLLTEPVDHEGLHLAVGGSVGIACHPDDGLTPKDLLRRADMALYQAKQARGAVSRYRSDLDDHTVGKITLAGELRGAIAGRQLVFLYQPQVGLLTGTLQGAEALARWCHPTRGLLPPAEFIDLVERSGLFREFALHALNSAARQAVSWRIEGMRIPVSVNLSARNFLDPGLPDDVERVLTEHGLAPEGLIIELTETTMISDLKAMEAVLTRLRGVGVQLSVDDFGTGYSSLAFLQRIEVNEIKVDRSFVRSIPDSEPDTAIVRATIDLAHGLGIRVVAEGVETERQLMTLRELGCDLGQGWLYGKPVPGGQLTRAWNHSYRHSAISGAMLRGHLAARAGADQAC